jgi:hypothetical protein
MEVKKHDRGRRRGMGRGRRGRRGRRGMVNV